MSVITYVQLHYICMGTNRADKNNSRGSYCICYKYKGTRTTSQLTERWLEQMLQQIAPCSEQTPACWKVISSTAGTNTSVVESEYGNSTKLKTLEWTSSWPSVSGGTSLLLQLASLRTCCVSSSYQRSRIVQ